MFDIAFMLMIEFINNLSWIVPMFLVLGIIGSLIKQA